MLKTKRQKFLIMKSIRFSESDLILQCLSAQGEKMSLLARGALKSRKRFIGGVLEPSHLVEFLFSLPRLDNQLSIIQEANLIEDFKGLRDSYEKLQLGLFFLDYIRRISQEGDINSDGLFNLLGFSLKNLASEEFPNFSLIKTQFLLKALHHQGVLPFKSWMSPFLKFKINEYSALSRMYSDGHFLDNSTLFEKLIETENMANNYVRLSESKDDNGCNFSTVTDR